MGSAKPHRNVSAAEGGIRKGRSFIPINSIVPTDRYTERITRQVGVPTGLGMITSSGAPAQTTMKGGSAASPSDSGDGIGAMKDALLRTVQEGKLWSSDSHFDKNGAKDGNDKINISSINSNEGIISAGAPFLVVNDEESQLQQLQQYNNNNHPDRDSSGLGSGQNNYVARARTISYDKNLAALQDGVETMANGGVGGSSLPYWRTDTREDGSNNNNNNGGFPALHRRRTFTEATSTTTAGVMDHENTGRSVHGGNGGSGGAWRVPVSVSEDNMLALLSTKRQQQQQQQFSSAHYIATRSFNRTAAAAAAAARKPDICVMVEGDETAALLTLKRNQEESPAWDCMDHCGGDDRAVGTAAVAGPQGTKALRGHSTSCAPPAAAANRARRNAFIMRLA